MARQWPSTIFGVSKYFRLRYDRQLQMRQQLIEKHPELKGQKIEYALDSTSISSYSRTNALAQYGRAKQNAHLKQINETFV